MVGASKVARDITERKKTEEALKKAAEEAEAANRERLQLLDREREARLQAERANRLKERNSGKGSTPSNEMPVFRPRLLMTCSI